MSVYPAYLAIDRRIGKNSVITMSYDAGPYGECCLLSLCIYFYSGVNVDWKDVCFNIGAIVSTYLNELDWKYICL